MEYSSFPEAYKLMVLQLVLTPQPVEEVLLDYSDHKFLYKGFIRNGFMMGNPVTKSVLHLLHVSELNLAKKYNQTKYGVLFKRYIPPLSVVQNNISMLSYLDHR